MQTSNRTRAEKVEIRFTPAEAEKLRTAVKGSGKTTADYILDLVDNRPQVSYDLSAVALMSEALSQLAHVTGGLRKLDANIERSMGLLKSFFNDYPEQAGYHREEINAVFRQLSALDDAVVEKLGVMITEIRSPRDRIDEVMRMVLGKNQ